MDNDTKFSLLDLLDGRVSMVVGLFICLVALLIMEPILVANANKERQKQLNKLNLEKTKVDDIDNFFLKTFYNGNYFDYSLITSVGKQQLSKNNKKTINTLNEYLKTGNKIEIEKVLNETNYNETKFIYLKGNINKIENICKIYKMTFKDCNLIKWNDSYSEKLLNDNIKILEIN